MERRELEDRIRASLQARADDVQPTPELWERVSEQTTRRARWQLGLWALSGAAAVAVLVLGGIVLLGQQDGVRIDPQPDVADTPTETVTDDPTSVPTSDRPAVVTTDGTSLYEVDPDSGEVVRELGVLEGFEEPNAIREVAVRPAADGDVLTVALVLEREGTYDLVLMDVAADGARTEQVVVGQVGTAEDPPPSPVWSEDGRYVLWAGPYGPSSEDLWAYDAVERPVEDGFGQAVAAGAPGAAGPLFAADTIVDLHIWQGASDGESVVQATTAQGSRFQVGLARVDDDCGGVTPCPPQWQVAVTDLGFEGGSPVDLGVLDTGVDLTLVARGGTNQDAEGGGLELVAGAMGDGQTTLAMPRLTEGSASLPDGWLAAAGDRVAVGVTGTAYLLTIAGDTVEDATVTDTTPLPDGTLGASVVVRRGPPPSGSAGQEAPTATDDAPAPLDEDGAPRHVVAVADGGDSLALVDRAAPEEPVATWGRPDGVDGDMSPVGVVVHPASTADHLEVVTRWSIGESDVLVRTVVRDGQVVQDAALPPDSQPSNVGGSAETADSATVFSPDGTWLAWVETPEGAAGPARITAVPWDANGPAGPAVVLTAPDDLPRPVRLLDWAPDPDGDVLTLAPMAAPGGTEDRPTGLVEVRLRVEGGTIAEPTSDDWELVETPGVVFAAGSYASGDGVERYVAFQRDDEVVVSVVDAPETAVPTGAFAFSEGRVVAWGPGSAVVQRGDGGWQRVQVDDGAATAVAAPEGTAAFLPWP